jgi:hypothetical protein
MLLWAISSSYSTSEQLFVPLGSLRQREIAITAASIDASSPWPCSRWTKMPSVNFLQTHPYLETTNTEKKWYKLGLEQSFSKGVHFTCKLTHACVQTLQTIWYDFQTIFCQLLNRNYQKMQRISRAMPYEHIMITNRSNDRMSPFLSSRTCSHTSLKPDSKSSEGHLNQLMGQRWNLLCYLTKDYWIQYMCPTTNITPNKFLVFLYYTPDATKMGVEI